MLLPAPDSPASASRSPSRIRVEAFENDYRILAGLVALAQSGGSNCEARFGEGQGLYPY